VFSKNIVVINRELRHKHASSTEENVLFPTWK